MNTALLRTCLDGGECLRGSGGLILLSVIMEPCVSSESKPSMCLVHAPAITLLMLVLALVACTDHEQVPVSRTDDAPRSLNVGYGILHTALWDEQYLKIIRLTKSIVTFKTVSEPTRHIIDDIAQASSTALEELEQLASLSPEIAFDSGMQGQIEQITRRRLRITTVKEFLTSRENFEIVLLISQTQALRYISHLARELQDIEANTTRKDWLGALSERFEELYLRALSRLKIA